MPPDAFFPGKGIKPFINYPCTRKRLPALGLQACSIPLDTVWRLLLGDNQPCAPDLRPTWLVLRTI